MPPLRRQRTRESLLSWWSDSNSLGATIPLHTFAKPLSKLLHNRQASGLVRKYRDLPLSKESLDIFSAYLVFQGISSATRSVVLEDLVRRTRQETEASAFVEANILPFLMELLETREENILRGTCRLLKTIASWPSLRRDFKYLDLRPLFILLRHSDTAIRQDALYTWARVVSPEILLDLVKTGVSAALETLVYPWVQVASYENLGHFMGALLKSPDVVTMVSAYKLIQDMFEQQFPLPNPAGIIEILFSKLVASLDHNDRLVKTAASSALQIFTKHPHPVVQNRALFFLSNFLASDHVDPQLVELIMEVIPIGNRFNVLRKNPALQATIYGCVTADQLLQVPGRHHIAFEGYPE